MLTCRDSFQNVVELLDDMFQRAAAADEPSAQNYVKKHSEDMSASGIDGSGARLFSNPAGDYGSMVNERVGASNWTDSAELGDTWASRNSFSYGRGQARGEARGDVLRKLLKTTDRVVQMIDSVEYGLTDIQEYYANTGALLAAAKDAKGGEQNGDVGCSVVEAFGEEGKVKELDDLLRLEYRSKLLNPKWAKAMASQVCLLNLLILKLVAWRVLEAQQKGGVLSQKALTVFRDGRGADGRGQGR
jgi:magnesium chelatase subunit H